MLRTAIFASALAAAPALAETITIDTYTGPVEVEAQPAKIAVFDIGALDTLDALGVNVSGVVGPLFVDYVTDTAEDADKVGSLFEPDYEAIAGGDYDLLIAAGRSSRVAPDLAKIAPTIDMTILDDTVGEGLDRLDAYGEIFGKQDEAAALRADFDVALSDAKEAVAGQGNALIVMTNGPTVSAYGASGRFGWLHTALDLPEAVVEVEQATHGEAISFEFIREANPDILIVVDRAAAVGKDAEAAATTLDNALVQETNAWQSGKVIYLDPAPLYIARGGIQSMIGTLGEITAAFSGS
ncbi:Iron compound ABC transporter, periplasmic iron compound-binding protein [Candidatus Rhodobacter oscarellae]|uniref:Iron compound ABC transporter, periplasmic iron compound-binding protein n=1 Tax=Candidatus Rhodobacter oscarellae TaxID=1675527 RepID=A0A0J9E0M7_9RHOB|nr:siderophore ABC transporter substrate-binding protein [Candidatus Rhodobacter lobularis]KMW56202.1 Iron compound ABC transporter, periplasmic iron compound-binding protein [Candidatus Rhodobacter lobularis]